MFCARNSYMQLLLAQLISYYSGATYEWQKKHWENLREPIADRKLNNHNGFGQWIALKKPTMLLCIFSDSMKKNVKFQCKCKSQTRVLKFRMGVLLTKKWDFRWWKKLGEPPSPPRVWFFRFMVLKCTGEVNGQHLLFFFTFC